MQRPGSYQLNCPWHKRISSSSPSPPVFFSPSSHPLLKLWSSSVHWMWTTSWFSSWSALPHVMVKSFISLRAWRRESIVSAVIWIMTPSKGGKKAADLLYSILRIMIIYFIYFNFSDNSFDSFQHFCSQCVALLTLFSPSTMLVLAKKPDEAFKAPLNTKKQAPVTETNKEIK